MCMPTYTLQSHDIYGGLGLGKTYRKNRKSRIAGQPESCVHACERACVCVYDDDDDDDEIIIGISAMVAVKAE